MYGMRISLLIVILALPWLGGGCALVRKGMEGAVAPMADSLAVSLQRQQDVDLVRDGAPAYLLLLDGMVDARPDNPKLLLAAADAQSAYALAFLDRAEQPRAHLMYGKARDYGLRILQQNKAFAAALQEKNSDRFAQSLEEFKARDVPALFTTANAWAGWILSSKGSMEAVAQFSWVLAMMQRVHALNPDYRQGGVNTFFGIYYAVQPLGAGRDLEKSKGFFDRAMAAAGPDYLLPHVAYAEFYARYTFDRELFEKTLQAVLASNPQVPDFALLNAVAKLRAQALLDKADDFF